MAKHISKNLKPIKPGQLSKEELLKRAHNGGVKSGEARREKKLMSEFYANFLEKKHKIYLSGKEKQVDAQELIDNVITKVLSKGKGESVAMLREIREATEGSKTTLLNPDGTPMVMPTQVIVNGVKNNPQPKKK